MSKFVALLVVYSAAVSSLLLYEHMQKPAAAGRAAAPDTFLDPDNSTDKEVRRVMAEVRALLADEVKSRVEAVDWQLSRIEGVRESFEAGLAATQDSVDQARKAATTELASLRTSLGRLTEMNTKLDALGKELGELAERVQAVEDRPPQIIKQVGGGGPATPQKPASSDPAKPTLPQAARQDPEVVRQEVAKARTDLQSDKLDVVFSAIEKIRKHHVVDAVPRLLEILSTFGDEFGRTAAAAALGHMKIADAVPGLTEALVDKSSLVAQQANKSIRQITGYDSQMTPNARVRERRTVRTKIKEWWRAHEQEVRTRLGQPGGGG